MRFRYFIGVYILLASRKTEAATQAPCDIRTREWSWNYQTVNLRTCFLSISKVTEEDFTISAPSDRTIPGFYFSDTRGVEFLPTNLGQAFPDLIAFGFLSCALTYVDENHFKGLSKLKDLNVGFNRISQVASNAFVDLVVLEGLSLGNNRIRFLMKNTFAPLKTLRQLYLDNNEISTLHPKLFDSLVNLQNLILHANDITSLDENIFESLTSLKKISLHHNGLERIPKDLFKFNSNLEYVWLNDNKIKSLRSNMLDHLSSLKYVDFQHNLCANGFYHADRFDAMRRDLKQNCADFCGVSQLELGLIVRGDQFVRGSFPWIVALLYTRTRPYKFFCGGTLISRTFVVSAAHCILNKGASSERLVPRDIVALFGAHDLSNPHEIGRVLLSPKKIYLHDDWNHLTRSYDADISLLEFEPNEIHFNDYIQPICLWDPKTEPTVTEGIVTGWGKSEDPSRAHENLPKMITAPIQTNEQCFLGTQALVDLSSIRTFCAGLGNGSGVCFGDSGGGMFIKMGVVHYLKGIVSSSLIKDNECDVSRNTVYTNVLKFRDWIESITGELVF